MDSYKQFCKDKQGKRGEEVVLYVKGNLECTEANYGDCGSPVECLWVKIKRVISKRDLTVGICYQPLNRNGKADEGKIESCKQVSEQQNLVLMGNFDYPDICWKSNRAAQMSSISFLECIEDYFLM